MRNLAAVFPIPVLLGASGFFLYDITVDLAAGTDSSWHLLIEGGVFIATIIVLYMEISRVIRLRRAVHTEQVKVYRLSGKLFDIIHQQFDEWKLRESEKEIAIMLIKGYSMREISELRGVREKTIRQQATGIYSKSGFANRYELAAHFIQDLINASPPEPPSPGD